jgi:hypothetical protein
MAQQQQRLMTDATRQYRERMHGAADANIDRHDPERMLAALKLQGVLVTRIQMRTLLWDDRAQMQRHLVTNPLLGQTFICLVREDLEGPLDNRPPVREID